MQLTELYRDGWSLREIQHISGHKSLQSLQDYMETSEISKRIEEIYDKALMSETESATNYCQVLPNYSGIRIKN